MAGYRLTPDARAQLDHELRHIVEHFGSVANADAVARYLDAAFERIGQHPHATGSRQARYDGSGRYRFLTERKYKIVFRPPETEEQSALILGIFGISMDLDRLLPEVLAHIEQKRDRPRSP